MTSPSDPQRDRHEELRHSLEAIRSRLTVLTAAVILLALAFLLVAAAVYGSLVNYFAGEAAIYAAASLGIAVLSFGCGWCAGRRR